MMKGNSDLPTDDTDHHVNLSHYLLFFCILNDCSVTSASHDFSFFCF